MEFSFLYFVGLGLTLLYAMDRFDAPKDRMHAPDWSKYTTTATKYYTGLIAYIATYAVAFHVLLLIPEIDTVVGETTINLENIPKELLSALILTVLMPSLKGVKEFDGFIKNKIYEWVDIPNEVNFMKKRIMGAHFEMSESDMRDITSAFIDSGMMENNLKKMADDEILEKTIKSKFIVNKLQVCMGKKEYKDFARHYEATLEKINESFNDTLLLVEAYVNSSESGLKSDKTVVKKLKKDVNNVFDKLCVLLSRAVISRFSVDSGRQRRLKELGIFISGKDMRISTDMIAMIFLGIFAINFVKYIIEGRVGNNLSNFGLSLQISLAYCIAVFWALYPKINWELARKKEGEFRSFFYYLLAAALTILSYAVVRVVIAMLEGADLNSYIEGAFFKFMPYQIPSAVAAFVLCFLLETSGEKINRNIDALIGVVLMLSATFLTKELMAIQFGREATHEFIDYAVNGLVAFLIFYTVPHWYRLSETQREQPVFQGEPVNA